MRPPTSRKEVCKFVGLVNYYRDICERRSNILAPLTKLLFIKVKCKWTVFRQKRSKKLSGLWPAIFYHPIRILINIFKTHNNATLVSVIIFNHNKR